MMAFVIVPNADDMDYITFCKHLNARHLDDLKLDGPFRYSELDSSSLQEACRAFHERVHKNGWMFGHEHEE